MTLFKSSSEQSSVFLEGASVSHPEGVWLDEVFGEQGERSEKPQGLLIELISSHKILDLSMSSCIVEFISKVGSVKFRPYELNDLDSGHKNSSFKSSFPVFTDDFNRSSLVIVNWDKQPTSLTCRGAEELVSHLTKKTNSITPAESVVEVELPLTKTLSQEKGGGYIHVPREGVPHSVAHYIMYRDKRHSTPVSVCVL